MCLRRLGHHRRGMKRMDQEILGTRGPSLRSAPPPVNEFTGYTNEVPSGLFVLLPAARRFPVRRDRWRRSRVAACRPPTVPKGLCLCSRGIHSPAMVPLAPETPRSPGPSSSMPGDGARASRHAWLSWSILFIPRRGCRAEMARSSTPMPRLPPADRSFLPPIAAPAPGSVGGISRRTRRSPCGSRSAPARPRRGCRAWP
jgi:hypothetical protein